MTIPALPYAGTSGWMGSETSHAATVEKDARGETSRQQSAALQELQDRGRVGLTWQELANYMGWHHGTASRVLSVLHKEGRLARLTITRDRCRVYVLPDYVNGRETEPHGRKPRACPNCGHPA